MISSTSTSTSNACTLLVGAAFLLISLDAHSESAEKLFAGADRKAGMMLHDEKACAACHAQRVSADGSAMYTRLDRKVKTPEKLLAQVAFCNTQLSTAMFPEDERDVASFLNHDYYHFK